MNVGGEWDLTIQLSKNDPRAYIYLQSGKIIYPGELNLTQIDMNDVAVGLSRIFRYNGQTDISVLRHSLAIANALEGESPRSQLWALLHDAAETYIMDVPVPLQMYMNEWWVKDKQSIEHLMITLARFPGYVDTSIVNRLDKKFVEYEMNCTTSRMRHPGPQTIDQEEHNEINEFYQWRVSDIDLIDRFVKRVSQLQQEIDNG